MPNVRLPALALALALALTACGPARDPSQSASLPSSSPVQVPDLSTSGPPSESPDQSPEPASTAVSGQGAGFALPYDPQGSWDPYGGSQSPNLNLLGLVAQGFFRLDEAFAPQPLLAGSIEEGEDGLTWTLELKAGLTFSDGAPLDAETAQVLVDRARGEKSLYRTRLRHVKKVAHQGDTSLIFTLDSPNKNFPALLDFPLVRVGQDGVPLGTGPYALEGERLVQSPAWAGAVPTPVIPLTPISDNNSLLAALDAGTVALAPAGPAGSKGLVGQGTYQVWDYPTTDLVYLGFRLDRGFCRNANFREAAALALDPALLVDQTLGGHGTAARLPIPPGHAAYDAALAGRWDRDLDRAGELLDRLGYPLGSGGLRTYRNAPVALELLVNGDEPQMTALAQALADQLASLGLTVTVKAMTWETYKRALEQGDYDLFLAQTRLTADLDLAPFYDPATGLCPGLTAGAATREVLEEALASGNWSAALELWGEELPFAPLCFLNGAVLARWGQVEGAVPSQSNLFDQFETWRVS